MKINTLFILFVLFLSSCATEPTGPTIEQLERASANNAKLGASYLSRGFIKKARSKLLKALKQDPDNAYAHGIYGSLLGRIKDDKEAQKHFEKSLELDPKDSNILNNYGAFLCGINKVEKAERVFLEVLSDPLYETPEFALLNAGICVMDNEDYDSAIGYFKRTLKQKPSYAIAYYYLANSYFLAEFYQSAEKSILIYHSKAGLSGASLWLGYQIANKTKNRKLLLEYAFKLKYRFPEAPETQLLLKKENERKI